MSETTMQPEARTPELERAFPGASSTGRMPRAEDEGLSLREIRWIPVLVPLAALTMLLGAAAVLSTA